MSVDDVDGRKPDRGRSTLVPLRVLALQRQQQLVIPGLELVRDDVHVHRRQWFRRLQLQLHEGPDVAAGHSVVHALEDQTPSMVEITACAEVNEYELAVRLDDYIRGVWIGMERDVVVQAPVRRVHQPARDQLWVDIQL